MKLEDFNTHRKTVATSAGDIAYIDVGNGPTTLFLHGVFLSSYLWHDVVAALRDERRCIAFDLPAHGRTRAAASGEPTLPALAEVVELFCTALDLDQVDLVANDTGGAIAQVFAAHHPDRLRSLVLTNCDTHDQLPPEAFKPVVEAARQGLLAPTVMQMAADPEAARRALASGYEHPERLSDQVLRDEYFAPFATSEGARELERALVALRASDLMAVEPLLAELDVPTLLVWGTGDVFFDVAWAYWLKDAIKGAERVVEIPGGKLFYPDERAAELVPHLRAHWAARPASNRRAAGDRFHSA